MHRQSKSARKLLINKLCRPAENLIHPAMESSQQRKLFLLFFNKRPRVNHGDGGSSLHNQRRRRRIDPAAGRIRSWACLDPFLEPVSTWRSSQLAITLST